jgi:hypothetical protein
VRRQTPSALNRAATSGDRWPLPCSSSSMARRVSVFGLFMSREVDGGLVSAAAAFRAAAMTRQNMGAAYKGRPHYRSVFSAISPWGSARIAVISGTQSGIWPRARMSSIAARVNSVWFRWRWCIGFRGLVRGEADWGRVVSLIPMVGTPPLGQIYLGSAAEADRR